MRDAIQFIMENKPILTVLLGVFVPAIIWGIIEYKGVNATRRHY